MHSKIIQRVEISYLSLYDIDFMFDEFILKIN